MADDDNTSQKSPYDEFVERSRRYSRRIAASWGRQPPGATVQIALLVVTALYALFTYQLLRTASSTLQTSVHQLEVTDRPWLGVELRIPQPPRVTTPNDIAFFVEFDVHNHGRSVATAISVAWTAYPQEQSHAVFTEPLTRQQETCSREDRVRGIEFLLFPDQRHTVIGSVTFQRDVLEQVVEKAPPRPGSGIGFFAIVGCVNYTYPTATARHHTGFMYMLSRRGPGGLPYLIDPAWLFANPLTLADWMLTEDFTTGTVD
jgi:hypothetical protein